MWEAVLGDHFLGLGGNRRGSILGESFSRPRVRKLLISKAPRTLIMEARNQTPTSDGPVPGPGRLYPPPPDSFPAWTGALVSCLLPSCPLRPTDNTTGQSLTMRTVSRVH